MISVAAMVADQNGLAEITGRKESNCVRCRNHGLKIILRGHKQYCPYAACTCDKCRFTAEQCRQMRLQNAIRRSEAQSGTPNRRQRHSSSAVPAMVSPQPAPLQQQVQQHTVVQQVQIQHQPPQQMQQHQQIIVTTVASDQRNSGTPHGENIFVVSLSFAFREYNQFIITIFLSFLRFYRMQKRRNFFSIAAVNC